MANLWPRIGHTRPSWSIVGHRRISWSEIGHRGCFWAMTNSMTNNSIAVIATVRGRWLRRRRRSWSRGSDERTESRANVQIYSFPKNTNTDS